MLVLTALTAFMATHYFPWEYMPSFMRMIQFPFRLLTFLIFGMSAVAGLSIINCKDSGHVKVRYTGTKFDNIANVVRLLSSFVGLYLLMKKRKKIKNYQRQERNKHFYIKTR